MRALGPCFLVLALGACDPKIEQAKKAIRDLQKDPKALEFRNVQECPTRFYVTGEVKDKNADGADDGYKTFYANTAVTHIVGDDEATDEDYRKMCVDQNYKDSEIARIDNEAATMMANGEFHSD